jgi:hypothetical protein
MRGEYFDPRGRETYIKRGASQFLVLFVCLEKSNQGERDKHARGDEKCIQSFDKETRRQGGNMKTQM